MTAAYPSGWSEKPSGNWWKFGFPVFYVTDILQIVEALVGLGCGSDPRLANALTLIRDKQDAHGRWPLEYDYAGKTWGDFGPKKQSGAPAPNKWVTLRAARVLRAAHDSNQYVSKAQLMGSIGPCARPNAHKGLCYDASNQP